MQTDNKALWRECAKAYDGMLNIIPYRNLLLEIVDSAEVKPGMKVLDMCCGTGNLLWALRRREIICEVTGVDIADTMILQAEAKRPLYKGKTSFIEADANQPAETWGVSGGFDRVICNNAIYMLDDPPGVLRKFSSLAAPGAVLVISTPHANPSSQAILDEHMRQAEASGMSREEALGWMTPRLQPLMECSSAILERYGDIYHSPNRTMLQSWFESSGWNPVEIRTTYAGQNWLITAERN